MSEHDARSAQGSQGGKSQPAGAAGTGLPLPVQSFLFFLSPSKPAVWRSASQIILGRYQLARSCAKAAVLEPGVMTRQEDPARRSGQPAGSAHFEAAQNYVSTALYIISATAQLSLVRYAGSSAAVAVSTEGGM